MKHRWRHVHRTLVDIITEHLDDAGWMGAPINYGATPVTVVAIQPLLADQKIDGNTVAITLDTPGPSEDAELGTGLMKRKWQLFVDVYGTTESITYAICEDVEEFLTGLRANIVDHNVVPPAATTELIEIDEVHVDEPPEAGQVETHTWRVVTCAVDVYYLRAEQ